GQSPHPPCATTTASLDQVRLTTPCGQLVGLGDGWPAPRPRPPPMVTTDALTVPVESAEPTTVTWVLGTRSAVVPWLVLLMRAEDTFTWTSLPLVSWSVMVPLPTAVLWPAMALPPKPPAPPRPPPPPPKPPPPPPPAPAPPPPTAAVLVAELVDGGGWFCPY